MTVVILRPVAAWSDLGHSEIDRDGSADFQRSNRQTARRTFRCRGARAASCVEPVSGCRSKAPYFSRLISTDTLPRPRGYGAPSRSLQKRVRPSDRNLAHEHKRQSGTEHNQERPDEEFQPINRGDVARPQIIPARHGDGPPCPWQLRHNVEPRRGVPSPKEEMLGTRARPWSVRGCRSGPIRKKV